MEALDVYLNEIKAGQLRDDNGRMNFAYSTDYLLSTSHEPLSHSLPLRKEPYGHEEVEPVLSNLLPDDIIRTRCASQDSTRKHLRPTEGYWR